MHRISHFSLGSPTPIAPPRIPTGGNSTQPEQQAQVQAAVNRKDWTTVQSILTACPETYRSSPPAASHPVLVLNLADTRELGDFVERLPPDAHLPTVVVCGADLCQPDQRVAGLTAHRHCFGLRLENCALNRLFFDLLTQGALAGQAQQHAGLRVLAWTHTCTPSTTELFSMYQADEVLMENQKKVTPAYCTLDRLILSSPHLEEFAISGLVPSYPRNGGHNTETRWLALMPCNLLAALASAPLKRLHMDNFCWYALLNLREQDAAHWKAWAGSQVMSLQQLQLSRWCMGGLRTSDELDINIRHLLRSPWLVQKHGPSFELICSDMPEAQAMGEALGWALRQRASALTVKWHSSETRDDFTWKGFASTFFGWSGQGGHAFDAPLSLHLEQFRIEPVLTLSKDLWRVTQLTHLTVTGDCQLDQEWMTCCRPDDIEYTPQYRLLDAAGMQAHLEHLAVDQLIETYCQMLGAERSDQDYADDIDLINAQINQTKQTIEAAKNQSLGGQTSAEELLYFMEKANRKITKLLGQREKVEAERTRASRLRQHYAALKYKLATNKAALQMVHQGFDLGHAMPMNRDVSAAIARQCQSRQNDMGRTLLPLALTNQHNYRGWTGVQGDTSDSSTSIGQ